MPEKRTVFTGDLVYFGRLLGVGPQSSISGWPAAFETLAALDARHIVPGDGPATTLDRARAEIYDYLMTLREKIGALVEEGGDIMEAPGIDQSSFVHLKQYESLAGRNAQTAFEQMEWE